MSGNDLADRLQAELDEYPTFMDLMEMQERLGPLADFLDALGFDHDAELVRRMLFPSGTVADLRATVREQAEQLDTLRAAIGDPDNLRLLARTFDLPILARIAAAAAAAPQDPERCACGKPATGTVGGVPTCGDDR